jgi:protein TonB
MKRINALLAGALLVSAPAHADFFLTPISTPQPRYPERLSYLRHAGKVAVEFDIRADGSVGELAILQSTHPAFTRVVRKALDQWRYQPWRVDGENAAAVRVKLAFVFSDLDPAGASRSQLRSLAQRCSDLLEERERFVLAQPDQPLSQMATFAQVQAYLNQDFTRGQVSSRTHRMLIEQLHQAWARVLASCEEAPTRRFIEFLP